MASLPFQKEIFVASSRVKTKTLKDKHVFYILHICLMNQGLVAKSSFLFGFFFSQNMIFKGILALYFTSASHFEAFLGA
jgi:hypothetical protein